MKIAQLILVLFFFAALCTEASESFLGGQTNITNPMKLRDPFKAPSIEKKKSKEKSDPDKGFYTNLGDYDALQLASVKVLGILSGANKRAIISAGTGDNGATYMLSEGSKIANGNVVLKSILPRGVIFVEKVTNIYGQPEYLETVVPISE